MTGLSGSFLKEFVSRPHEIGSIVPSSPALARQMVEGIDWERVDVAVEYGPGLGAITTEILRRMAGKTFFAVELNAVYASSFARRFPHVSLYRDSVKNIVEIAARNGVSRIDCVISGLPWANFSDALQDELIDPMMDVLSPDGQFVTFAYIVGLVLPSARRFRRKLEKRFELVERSRVVWRNTPPAFVYRCRRQPAIVAPPRQTSAS